MNLHFLKNQTWHGELGISCVVTDFVTAGSNSGPGTLWWARVSFLLLLTSSALAVHALHTPYHWATSLVLILLILDFIITLTCVWAGIDVFQSSCVEVRG